MTERLLPGDEKIPGDSGRRVDAACDAFEAAWRAGQSPRIEEYLARAPERDRRTLLGELLALEQELRGPHSRPGAAEWLKRFPDYADVVHAHFPSIGGAAGTSPTPIREDIGRNLLFGILALQNNFISRDDLMAAFAVWVADKSRPLSRILVDRGTLDATRQALLEALVVEHLRHHGGLVEESLAAVSSLGSVREDLERLDDPGLQASLEATTSRSFGEATARATPSARRVSDRFRIIRFHREGGLGRVFVARDEELGREVALKEIRPDKVSEASLRTRFVLEAEINGGLEHPGIVPVYSLGSYGDGRPFYAMRFVEGDSLKEAIEAYHKEHPRPDPLAGEFRRLMGRFIDVCEAIAFAHSRGVLHRDLKPHNVMLGKYGETLLIDWGLAKATGRRETGEVTNVEATLVPPSGSGHAPTIGVLGSPQYMSPEQARGEVETLGPATDVYGLGAVLFALLTGKPPVEGKSTEEILDRVRRVEIQTPRSLNPNIPRALDAVCMKCLALNPVDRYPTARALADDVERWLADEPVSAWRDRLLQSARRWARRHRTAATGVAVGLAAGVIGLGVLAAIQAQYNTKLNQAYNKLADANDATTRALSESRVEKKKADQALAESLAVSDFLVEAFRSPDPSQDGMKTKVVDLLDRAEARLDNQFAGSPVTKGALLYALGNTYAGLGLHDRAVKLQTKSAAVRDSVLGSDHQDTLRSRRELAVAYRDTGRLSEAIELQEAIFKMLESKLGLDHPDTLQCRHHLAVGYFSVGRLVDAAKLFEATLKRRESVLGRSHPDTLTSRNAVAAAYSKTGRLVEAIALDVENLKLRESVLGPDHPDTLATRNNLAGKYYKAGRFSEAISLSESTLKLREMKLGPDHPHTLASRDILALNYQAVGRYTEAISIYEPLVKLKAAKQGEDHPDTLNARNNLALTYWSANRLLEAIKLHESNLKLYETRLGPKHPNTLMCRNNLARAYKAVGRYLEAISLHESTLELREQTLGFNDPDTLTSRADLASAYHAAGRLPEALALYESTLKLQTATPGNDDELTWTRGFLAELYESLGRWSEAEGLYREVLAVRRRTLQPDSSHLADNLMALGRNLLVRSRGKEAEQLLREAVSIFENTSPDDWSRYSAMSLLGGALLNQGRFAAAESLVIAGYEGMKAREGKIAVPDRYRIREAAERVVGLYEVWHQPEQAAQWKQRLGLADLPQHVFDMP